jgi:hypothetical protein
MASFTGILLAELAFINAPRRLLEFQEKAAIGVYGDVLHTDQLVAILVR